MPRIVIVGAGLSGLALAHELLQRGVPRADVQVLEASDRPGGLLRTLDEEGYRVEGAANGFLDNAPATLRLCEDLGLDLVRANESAAKRFLVKGGRLVELPTKPQKLLASPALGAAAKARALLEATVPPAPEGVEESVAAFAERRFGPGVAPLVDAAATGIFAGDPARLSLDHAFPRLRALEREHGSVLKGLLAERKEGARHGVLTAPRGGMGELVEELAHRVPVRLNARVRSLRARARGGVEVQTEEGRLECERAVLAVPPSVVSQRLGVPFPPQRVAPVAVVALGYPRARARGAMGFGYLAPARQGRFALGAVFESNLFPERAPEGHVLVRALVGGARDPERARLGDGALVDGVVKDLQDLRVVEGHPVYAKVLRTGGIPQLDVGHGAILARAEELTRKAPGLRFAGVGWRAVAVNGLVAEAERLAEELA